MNVENYKYGLCRYRFNECRLLINGQDPYIINTMFILNVILEKNFDEEYFPFFMVEVGIPNKIYRELKKENQMSKLVVDFQCGQFQSSSLTEGNVKFTSYIKGEFFIFLEDMSPDLTEEQQKLIEEAYQSSGGLGYQINDMKQVKLLLYQQDFLFNSKRICNAILSSSNLTDAITYVLNKSSIKNVLFSPAQNNRQYKEFVITPITAIEQLDRICNEYAIHNNGTMVFFDHNRMYLIEKTAKCTAYIRNEFQISYIYSKASTDLLSGLSMGCGTDSRSRSYLLNIKTDTLSITSLSGLNDQTFGNNFQYIDSATGEVSEISSGASKTAGSIDAPTQVIMRNKGDNTTSAIKHKLEEDSMILTAGFGYIDLEMLTPNKLYVTSIENPSFSQYNGKYRLVRYVSLFEKDGQYFAPMVTAEFKK